ncbi:hypothetical protein [Pseudomarimonas arenosa]|uniref:AmpE protein n=1 Tax=Pseudomarimonas arenosa TaxID=2774145 RepID=A0AAW3ZIH1_9GAMM|nr:hypothetical protein [Pseudomarimonas arenosa]MBD8524937.1 hypothetical protein [Pseudomarimonas arenosa]
MSIAMIALAVVLLVSHYRPQWAGWRRPDRVADALSALGNRLGLDQREGLISVLLLIVLPSVLLLLLQQFLAERWLGLAELALGVVVLFLCWGPRDLDADVAAVVDTREPSSRRLALQNLGLADPDAPSAPGRLFYVALNRWFGPLFWFVVLGPAGAILFRLTRLASDPLPRPDSALAKLRLIVDWPVAHLMTLALAVVGDFDTVAAAWRRWHLADHRGWWTGSVEFLQPVAECSVVVERHEQLEEAREEAEDEGIPPPADDEGPDPLGTALHDAQVLLWRILTAWLVVLAVLLLAGIAS